MDKSIRWRIVYILNCHDSVKVLRYEAPTLVVFKDVTLALENCKNSRDLFLVAKMFLVIESVCLEDSSFF